MTWAQLEACWQELASAMLRQNAALALDAADAASRGLLEQLAFVGLCRRRGVTWEGDVAVPGPLLAFRGYGADSRLALRESGATFAERKATLAGRERLLADHALLARVEAAVAGLGPGRPELLGRIHERLARLRLRPGPAGSVRLARGDEARKAAGVFYTPHYVARYMAARVLEGWVGSRPREPGEGPRPRVLDPACGCGVFLLAAARWLRRRYRRQGLQAAPDVLAEHLHGIDVDPGAALVARRALWLELMAPPGPRGERRDPSPPGARLMEVLARNVRPGDALADPAPRGGPEAFDVVLGNPPYHRERSGKAVLDRIAATELGRRYRAARMDLSYYFVHRALEMLRPGGRLALIVGSYWTAGRGAEKLIDCLRQTAHLEEVFCLEQAGVFPGVPGRHLILVAAKGVAQGPTTVKRAVPAKRADPRKLLRGSAPVLVFQKMPEQLFRGGQIDLEPPADQLLAKLARWPPLAELGTIRQGIVENPASITRRTNRQHGHRWTVGEGVFALTPAELARLGLGEAESRLIRPYYGLADLGRYFIAQEPSLRLVYSTAETCPQIDRFPVLAAHLQRFREVTESRRETRRGVRAWWHLHWPREERIWRSAKLIVLQMARRPAVVAASEPAYVSFSTNVLVPRPGLGEHLEYLAAVLNSRLLWKWCLHHAKRRGVGLDLSGHVLAQAPIRRIDFSRPNEAAAHGELVAMAGRMADLARRIRAGRSDEGEEVLRAEMADVDNRIDQAVYRLYGLTDAEMAAVEQATADAASR